jgi:elongation factor 1-beta
MPEFKDLTQDAGLVELNKHLESRSYVEGFKPSGADSSLLTSINASVDGKKYPHVARWLNHITSFSSCQRASWGGVVAAKPAAAAPVAAAKPAAKKAPVDDDDFGMSSSDSDDDEATKAIIAKKAAEKAEKNKGKPEVIARSSVILFVKPNEAETDMNELAATIKRDITFESLQWGDYELIPVAYGIKKLRIICVIEDDKVALDDLTEAIEEMEDVQSVDIDAFNKI